MVSRWWILWAVGVLSVGCVNRVDVRTDEAPIVRVIGRDAIRSIDHPEMITVAEVGDLIPDHEPVLGIFDGETARAYATWHLEQHEIVNDRLGDVPIAATW